MPKKNKFAVNSKAIIEFAQTEYIDREGETHPVIFKGFTAVRLDSIQSTHYNSLKNGRSSVLVTCAFCMNKSTGYIWSMAGGGKRCKNCGAYLHVAGYDYAITEQWQK